MVQPSLRPIRLAQPRSGVVQQIAVALFSLMLLIPVSGLQAQASIKPFLGRWDLTLKSPTHDLAAWNEVSEADGKPKVLFVGLTDHATSLAQVELKDGELKFVSPNGEEGFQGDTTFAVKLEAGRLVGTATSSKGTSWPLVGQRAPSLKRTTAPVWGKPITLFNGKDFTNWQFRDPVHSNWTNWPPRDPAHSNWTVENGELVNHGNGAEIITTSKFEDFKLHLEFKCTTDNQSNSGVYLRGRYELQIETNSVTEPPSHHTGGVYGFLEPTPELPRESGKWQTFDITLIGRNVTVVQNGRTIIDHKEIPGITGGAFDSNEGLPGPLYLQGSESGGVAYRNIVLTPAVK